MLIYYYIISYLDKDKVITDHFVITLKKSNDSTGLGGFLVIKLLITSNHSN